VSLQLYKHKEGEKIKPNRFVFPFEIPLPASLPSSQISKSSISEKGVFSIAYDLKLVKEESGKLYYQRDFSVVSADRVADERRPCLFQPDPFSVESMRLDGAGRIFMAGRIPDAFLLHGQDLEASLACLNKSTCDIERVDLILEEEYSWKTASNRAFAKVRLSEKSNVAALLPRLRVKPIREEQVDKDSANDETIARRMFQDLKKTQSRLSLPTPISARESYDGSLVKISHFLKIIAVTTVKPDSGYPSMRLPIQIGAKSYDTLKDAPPNYVSNQYDVRFPRATATADGVLVGKDAAKQDIPNNDNGSGKSDDGPTLEGLLEDLALSLDQYVLLSNKLKDIEWAIFFGSLSPEEFGTIINRINFGDVQTMVGVVIATAFGGDFTCAHCAEAISNTQEVFRTSMAESLLPYCVDLSESNEAIRDQLSEFEQIIVALHALDDQEEEDHDDGSPSPQSSRPSSHRPKTNAREDDDNATLSGSATPLKDDICIGDNEHPGTIDFLYIVREVVDEGAFQEFAPPVFRRIRKRAKGRRFLIRPFDELPHYWRIASDREKIEYCGQCYDRDSENLKKPASKSAKDDWGAGDEVDKGWQNDLVSGGNEWVLAMTVHTYASHIYDHDEDDDRPAPMDICFGKKRHSGNEAMKKAIRKHLPDYNYMEWAPPVYKAIKSALLGRRYFVPLEQGGWQQATQQERRTEMEKYYNAEKNAPRLPSVAEFSPPQNRSPKKKKPSSERPSFKRRTSTKERPKPLDEDVCFGLADHPGTKSLHNAVVQCLAEFDTTPWSPPVYKAIRAQLKDARFFIRTAVDSPWKEATATQRLERVRQQFEFSRKKKRMKVRT
jgi:hypothetical protein